MISLLTRGVQQGFLEIRGLYPVSVSIVTVLVSEIFSIMKGKNISALSHCLSYVVLKSPGTVYCLPDTLIPQGEAQKCALLCSALPR